jgi:uncharacterized protein (TIGR03437 family)
MPMSTSSARTTRPAGERKKLMSCLRLSRIFPVLAALTVCSSLHATQTLNPSAATINLLCTTGSPCTSNVANVSTYSATTTLTNTGAAALFTIGAPSVPWLSVSPTTATVPDGTTTPTTQVLTFTVTAGWTSLNTGLNTTTVHLTSGVGGASTFTVNIQVQAAVPTLTVQGGTNALNPVPYLTGSAAPTISLTLVSSSGLPLPFTVSVASSTTPGGVSSGWLTINAGSASGIAYSWGTTIFFTASPSALNGSNPGDYDTGTITITPTGQTPIIIPLNIAVNAGPPTLATVSPSLVPLLTSPVAPGFVNFVLHGTGFVATTGAQKTKVFIGTTALASAQVLTNYVTVLSPTFLQVAVPYSAAGLPFATAGATVLVIGVANGASPAIPSATVTLGVTGAPIISTVTSASSFVDTAAGTAPNVAPYDIISIFGTNLCPLCTGTNAVQVAAPDPTFLRFPLFVSPDGTHKISVNFTKPGAATTLPGYLLFATNNQINVLVPGAVAGLVGTASPNVGLVNVTVGYDVTVPASTANTSAAFQVTPVAYDPGVFTIESNGTGQGAITDASTFVLNSQTNFATSGTSTVAIFLTGLGAPDSAGANSNALTAGWSAQCIAPLGIPGAISAAPTGYMGTVNTPYIASTTEPGFQQPTSYLVPSPLWTSIDGAVINPAEFNANTGVANLAPCLSSSDTGAALLTVTIGSSVVTAVSTPAITFAGFVAGSIAGLYQINVPVPTGTGNGTTAAQLPVFVTLGTSPIISSQSGVTMWVK